ncbi:hypothetical protein DNTS_014162 [Danionella cerebrum]|uniref:A-kinase anchor protein 2 C-terminal domain-containing protein n=1 Tax=Danionella cerebrum TaxID=2873325 RepID=A0A553R7X3_9TELE|nr:hypothetical protein DNTS_014162 [Danionella translucida]
MERTFRAEQGVEEREREREIYREEDTKESKQRKIKHNMEADPEKSLQKTHEEEAYTIIDYCIEEQNHADIREANVRKTESCSVELAEHFERCCSPHLHDHGTSSPEDGAIETTMNNLTRVESNLKDMHGQKWPPVPKLEEDLQSEVKENLAIEIHDEVKEVTDGPVPINKGTGAEKANDEDGHDLESHGDSDSVVLLSENSDDLNIDCKSVDFSATRDQWVRRDSRCDDPQNVPPTKSSSDNTVYESQLSFALKSDSGVSAGIVQQREHEASFLTETQVGQQVCGDAPPLETVVLQPANQQQEDSTRVSGEVSQPLILAEQRRRLSESEEGKCSETGEERKQTEGEVTRLSEVKDQPQQQENKDKSHTKPQVGERKASRMQVDHFDDSQSDSGVSADFSPSSTTEVSDGHANLDEPPPNETPIEKEIRLAMKREQSLRRSRGLCHTTESANDYIEIPLRKPILSKDFQIRGNQTLDKDREFAGKKMQKEISAETEREKVLVELGRLPGFYDKGTEVQLLEKKMLFESFQEQKESTAALNRGSASNCDSESAAGTQDTDLSVNVKQRLMQFSQSSPITTASQYGGTNTSLTESRGPGLSEAIKSRIIIIEANSLPTAPGSSNGGHKSVSWNDGGVKPMSSAGIRDSSVATVSANREVFATEDATTPKENPFFKLRPSATVHSQVELDIKEAKERERELQKQRTSLYGAATSVPEVNLRTESRVKEETRSSGKEARSHSTPSPPGSQMSTSGRQSTGKLDLTWPPTQAEEQAPQTTEPKLLKTPRQRNILLERWESGKVNGHD